MNTINYNIKQMNKRFLTSVLILGIVPTMCLGASARYTALVRQKQQKIEQLEKCLGTQTNLKIAGISTLGLTAVGVAGNIAEAKIISDNNTKIEKLDDKIEKQKSEIERQKWENEQERLRKEEEAKQATANADCLKRIQETEPNATAAVENNGRCELTGCDTGYVPSSNNKCFVECTSDYLNSKNAISGEAREDGCYISACADGYHLEKNNEKITITSSAQLHKDIVCVKDAAAAASASAAGGNGAVSGNTSGEEPANTTTTGGTEEPSNTTTSGSTEEPAKTTTTSTTEKPASTTTTSSAAKPAGTTQATGKCTAAELQKVTYATEGKKEGSACKVTKCKGDLKANSAGNKCECPANTTPDNANPTKCTKVWTEAEKKANPAQYCSQMYQSEAAKACCMEIHKEGHALNWDPAGSRCKCKNDFKWDNNKCVLDTEKLKQSSPNEYCKKYFIEGQVLKETGPAYNCCMEIIKGNATTYNGGAQKCNCKKGFDWTDKDNKCVQHVPSISLFAQVQVSSLEQCKALVNIYSKHKGLNLTFVNSTKKSKQDYLYYKDSRGNEYNFEFDDCKEGGASGERQRVVVALCELYGGSPKIVSGGVACELSKSEASINADLRGFNSHYSYGKFNCIDRPPNIKCNQPSYVGFTWWE